MGVRIHVGQPAPPPPFNSCAAEGGMPLLLADGRLWQGERVRAVAPSTVAGNDSAVLGTPWRRVAQCWKEALCGISQPPSPPFLPRALSLSLLRSLTSDTFYPRTTVLPRPMGVRLPQGIAPCATAVQHGHRAPAASEPATVGQTAGAGAGSGSTVSENAGGAAQGEPIAPRSQVRCWLWLGRRPHAPAPRSGCAWPRRPWWPRFVSLLRTFFPR